MRMKVLALTVAFGMVLSVGACKKEEDRPITGEHPRMGAPGEGMVVAPVTQTVVPDNVKEKWNAVELTIEDKENNKTSGVVIKLGDEYVIPGSNLKVKVGDFLPDFRMEGAIITSASDQMNNPAVHVTVHEGDEELFKGWLYSRFPSIHPFMHEKYGITLTDAVKEG